MYGQSVRENLIGLGAKVVAFIDNDPKKWGKTEKGVPIHSPGDLHDLAAKSILVIAVSNTGAIQRQLNEANICYAFAERSGELGLIPSHSLLNSIAELEALQAGWRDEFSRQTLMAVLKARIFQDVSFYLGGSPFLHKVTCNMQYFVPELISLSGQEHFVDCGACDGDAIFDLYFRTVELGLPAPRVTSFEPDPVNAARLAQLETVLSLPKFERIQAAVGNSNRLDNPAAFFNCRPEDSSRSEIQVTTLDTALSGMKPSFIKMDIEGYEVDALNGAKEVIRSNRPKLAICVYHETSHILAIPQLIKTLVPEYRLALRHHCYNQLWETVCYATL